MGLIGFLLVGLLLGADRWLKWQAINGVTANGPFWHFGLLKNDALVFSWPAPNWLAIGLMLVGTAVIFYFMWRLRWRSSGLIMVGWMLILCGDVSNLYDRLIYGFVVDWANFGKWVPVFNLADLMVVFGLVVILRYYSIDKKPRIK